MRALFFAMIVSVVAVACVRMDPPDNFVCRSSSDCPADERCAQDGTCITKAQCLYPSECPSDQSCNTSTHQCYVPQCTPGHDDVCAGFKCGAGDVCQTTCTSDFDCQPNFTCDNLTLRSGCKPRPKYRGEACTSLLECQAGLRCCGPAGALVCGDCFGGGIPCTDASGCTSGLCCPGMFGMACSYSSTACIL